MNCPKVAVIIPNFNKAQYINDCLESVGKQTYKNIDIVVIDDASTDESVKIIKKLQKKYNNIRLFELKTNHGVSFARNYGINQTDAEFFVFLDSDDMYVNEKKIENEIKLANDDTVVFSQWVPMNTNGEILPYKKLTTNPYNSYFAISKILSITLPPYKQLRAYMIPRKLFDRIGGYDKNLPIYEDFDLQSRFAIYGKILYTGEIGEAYRLNTGGLSKPNCEYDYAKIIYTIRRKYIPHISLLQKIAYFILMKKSSVK